MSNFSTENWFVEFPSENRKLNLIILQKKIQFLFLFSLSDVVLQFSQNFQTKCDDFREKEISFLLNRSN